MITHSRTAVWLSLGNGENHIQHPRKWGNQEIKLKFSRLLWFINMNNIKPYNLLVEITVQKPAPNSKPIISILIA